MYTALWLWVVNHETVVESHWPHCYAPGLSEKDFTLGNVEQFSLSNPIKTFSIYSYKTVKLIYRVTVVH